MYKVLRGINYPDGQGGEMRHEADDLADIPEAFVAGYLECGAIVAIPTEPKPIQGRKASSAVEE